MPKSMRVLLVSTSMALVGAACTPSTHGDADCPYDQKQLANVAEPARSYTGEALALRHTADAWGESWNAEIEAMQKDLGLPPNAADDEAMLAKLAADARSLRTDGGCTLSLDASTETPATPPPRLARVTFIADCKDESKVASTLERVRKLIDAHFPKLMGLSAEYAELAPKRESMLERGAKLVQQTQGEGQWIVKCGLNLVDGIDAAAKTDFRIRATSAARGDAG